MSSHIALIVIGVAPTIIPTASIHSRSPTGANRKAFTLGAGDLPWPIAWFSQILPRARGIIRLNLKAVMLFLFAGEMIALNRRPGPRIALLGGWAGRNHPYVLWVALLLFLVDMTMRTVNRRCTLVP
jgi:NitT/TauT family transport system permease protein